MHIKREHKKHKKKRRRLLKHFWF